MHLTDDLQTYIAKSLNEKTCVVYKNRSLKWTSGNSIVTSSPVIDVAKTFNQLNRIEVAVNFISIRGDSKEDLHYHSSHLVGVIVRGQGWLMTTGDDVSSSHEMEVSMGDIVVIPRGISHLFRGDEVEGLAYIALEFSDGPIDYQKHWGVS